MKTVTQNICLQISFDAKENILKYLFLKQKYLITQVDVPTRKLISMQTDLLYIILCIRIFTCVSGIGLN